MAEESRLGGVGRKGIAVFIDKEAVDAGRCTVTAAWVKEGRTAAPAKEFTKATILTRWAKRDGCRWIER
jgi:hypothetical protein